MHFVRFGRKHLPPRALSGSHNVTSYSLILYEQRYLKCVGGKGMESSPDACSELRCDRHPTSRARWSGRKRESVGGSCRSSSGSAVLRVMAMRVMLYCRLPCSAASLILHP